MIQIDLTYLFQILLPINLRKSIITAYLDTVNITMTGLYNTFYLLFAQIKYDLTFNGQVILLEHLLNDKYDSILRRIYIDEESTGINTFIFNVIEDNEETYIFNNTENGTNIYLFNNSELSSLADFTIYVPSDVVFEMIQLRKLVDIYKLPTKLYSVEIV